MTRAVHKALIVEDDPQLQASLEAVLQGRASEIEVAGTVEHARRSIRASRIDLILLDVALPDGDAFDVLGELADVAPRPVVIAMSGTATPEESFRLAELGVRGYLTKPVRLDELEATIDAALSQAPNLDPHIRGAVGHVPIKDVEDSVRHTMVSEAMARTSGSRKGAARLLSISRQLLQYILRTRDRGAGDDTPDSGRKG